MCCGASGGKCWNTRAEICHQILLRALKENYTTLDTSAEGELFYFIMDFLCDGDILEELEEQLILDQGCVESWSQI